MAGRIILDLCGGSGAWSRPYLEAGFDVRLVTLPDHDVRTYRWPEGDIYGVLAAPPCTEFAVSGARWWASKPPERLTEAVEIVTACIRIIRHAQPWFWALENPVGRLGRFIGKPRYSWQPYEYGDPWRKRTCMWGNHNRPEPRPVAPGIAIDDRIWRMAPSSQRAALRSITPPGWARAFFEANP